MCFTCANDALCRAAARFFLLSGRQPRSGRTPHATYSWGRERGIFAAAPAAPIASGSSLRRRLDALWAVADHETIFIAAGDY